MMREPIKVLIVDDNTILRQWIRGVLSADSGIEVIGEACDGNQAVAVASELMPDVVLMDLSMPGSGGILATRNIIKESPHIRIVILTASGGSQDLVESIKAGAIGYLVKDAPKEKIIKAIKKAYSNKAIVSSSLAASLLEEFKKLVDSRPESTGKIEILTQKETEILKLLAQGLDNKKISKTIFVSEGTVKNHVSNILTKLQLENRVQASVLAAKEGLV